MGTGEWYPYYLVDRVTLDANGAGQSVLPIGTTEEFEADDLFFVVSSGTFNITSIQDSGGKGYTNADTNNPLPSAVFLTALDQRNSVQTLSTPLRIERNGQITITFASGTASATIDVIMKGKRRVIA